MRSGPRRSLRSSIVALVLAVAASAMVVTSAGAIGLFGALIVRTAVQTGGIRLQEREDRAAVNQRRDARLARIAAEEAGLAVKLERMWLTAEQVERERARLAQQREAVTQVALRERQIVSYQARRRIDARLRTTFRDAIAAATGADSRIVDFVTSMVRGENPLEAAIAAALSEQAEDPRQGFRDLRDRLREVRSAAAAIGGAETIAIRARLAEALREAAGLAEGTGPPPDDQLERLNELSRAVGRAAEQLGEIGDELFPDSPGLDPERFAGDERWQRWNATVKALDANEAKQALTSSILRRSADRIVAITSAAGVDLSEEDIAAIAAAVFSSWIDARTADGVEGGVVIDLDALVRARVNERLDAVGLDPLPDPDAADAPDGSDGEEAPPPRRVFSGEGTFAHDFRDRDGLACDVTLTVAFELSMEPDGAAGLFIGDVPSHRREEDALICFAAGAPQLYPGTWSAAEDGVVTAVIAFGSTTEAFIVTVSGDMPEGTASTATDLRYYGEDGGYVMTFDLAERAVP